MSVGRRAWALTGVVGCGVLPLAGLAWVTAGNIAAGRYLLAGVVLVPACGMLLTLLDRELRRSFVIGLGVLGLNLLGGEEELSREVLPEGRALRVAVRRGRARVTQHLIVWSQVVDVRTTVGQGGELLVVVEQIDAHVIFLTAESEDAQRALCARLEGWWREAALRDPAGERCALCHGALALSRARCQGCGTLSHPSCADAFGACPTLGCAAGPPATARDVSSLDVTDRVSWGERAGAGTIVGFAALAVGLLVGSRGEYEVVAGLVLGALCLALFACAHDEVAVFLGARRLVVRQGADLQVRLALGPLSLRLWRAPLASVLGVEAAEGARGGHVVRIRAAGGGPEVVARGMSTVAVRRLESVVHGWRGRGAAVVLGATKADADRGKDPADRRTGTTDPPLA